MLIGSPPSVKIKRCHGPAGPQAVLFLLRSQGAALFLEADAAVVLFQAARLAEVLPNEGDLELAADFLTAFHADARVRQGLDPLGGDLSAAPFAESLTNWHAQTSSFPAYPTASIRNYDASLRLLSSRIGR